MSSMSMSGSVLFRAALSPRRVVHAIGMLWVDGGDCGGMELRRRLRRSGIDKGPGRSGIYCLGRII